jgi:hypothetical protein
MTTTTKIAGEAMTNGQIEALWQSLPIDQVAFARDSDKAARDLRIAFARALLASKAAVSAAQDIPGWFVHNGATHTLEAAAEAGKTPQALAYAASQKAFLGLERICRAHGYNYQCVIHDWLEQALSAASTAAFEQSSEQDERAAFEAAWSRVYDTGDFLLRHYSATDQYANHDTQCAWQGWQLARAALTAPAQSCGDAEQADEAVTDAMIRRAILNEAADIAESMLLCTGLDIAQRLRDVAKNPFYLCDCISHEECKSLSGCQLKDKS